MFDEYRANKLLKAAPGPSPWYVAGDHPAIQTACGPGRWVAAGQDKDTAGKTFLQAGGKTLAVIAMYNYVLALDASTLVIWTQVPVKKGNTAPVHMAAIDCRQLAPLDNPGQICAGLPLGGAWRVAGGVIAELDIPTTEIGSQKLEFPSPLAGLDEILILANSSAVNQGDRTRMDECLLIAQPRLGTVEFIPQDWFNDGGFDFDYQWVTRVARDPQTGCVVGDGIRLGTFMLDESCRHIRKWLSRRA
jgi:hypothetical protein